MGLRVLLEIEGEQAFVEVKVGLREDVSFLNGESLGRRQLPQCLPKVLGGTSACFLEGREAAVVESRGGVSQFHQFFKILEAQVELL